MGTVLAAALTGGAIWLVTPPDQASDGPRQSIAATVREPVSLFNGKDLTGWVVDGNDPRNWWVEDGVITTTATRNGPRSWLLTERDYGDFVIQFEYRLARGGNTGLAFRAVPGERPVLNPGGQPEDEPYHLQVELADDDAVRWARMPTGQVHGGNHTDAPALTPIGPRRRLAVSEWSRARVELRGQTLRVTIDDEVVQNKSLDELIAQGSLFPGLRRRSGRVGFQQHTRAARFRNVQIEDLTPVPAAE